MPEFITFGETMAVMAPAEIGKIGTARDFSLRIAGAESNTAIGIARLGHTASWISAVGRDSLGDHLLSEIGGEGVDVGSVIIDEKHRTGLMLKELHPEGTKVYYYRENSALANFAPENITESLLSGVKIVHLSGITPKLSESARAAFLKLYSLARDMGILVSFDPNIRRKLWGDKDYTEELREWTFNSDIALIGLSEARELGVGNEPKEVIEALRSRGVKYAAIKDGAEGAHVMDSQNFAFIPPIKCNPIDPVGAGDGFNAGFISGLLEGRDVEYAGRMGAIVGALATETVGDVDGYPTREKLDFLMGGK